MMNRVFFSAGPMIMGVAPHRMEFSDRICAWYSCHWPVVLRKKGKNHVSIGADHVEGFMFGETMKIIDDGFLDEQEFHLG